MVTGLGGGALETSEQIETEKSEPGRDRGQTRVMNAAVLGRRSSMTPVGSSVEAFSSANPRLTHGRADGDGHLSLDSAPRSSRTFRGVVSGSDCQSGSVLTIAPRMSAPCPHRKLAAPSTLSYKTQPNDQISVRLSSDCARVCSGLNVGAVPRLTPVEVPRVSVGDSDTFDSGASCR